MSRLLLIFMGLFCVGCAGPMSPFGAINKKAQELLGNSEEKTHAVQFFPDRQVLHKTSDFKVRINASEKIETDYIFKIYYNGKDETKNFFKSAEAIVDQKNNQMELVFKNLRLPSNKFHDIIVAFRPSSKSEMVFAKYEAPTCLKDEGDELRSIASFSAPNDYLRWIRDMSRDQNVNPNLIAGLIAQESAFDFKAVSWAKAIGLTQVTQIADTELKDNFPEWPRNDEIPDLPVPILKAMIATGKINRYNEWRLDPKKSIEGGISYFNYLVNYWEMPHNAEYIKQNFVDYELGLSQAVLASYNSGMGRVKRGFKERGKDWLHHKHLGEARRYVQRVSSYCYHFSRKEY